MHLYPAIDIKSGQCIGLKQGKLSDLEVYSHSPVKVAKHWEKQGAKRLHVIDLDAALSGHVQNQDILSEIIKAVNIPVQAGGGLRSIQSIEEMLKLGASRVILGTKVVENPQFVSDAVSAFGTSKILVGIDVMDGFIATDGWSKFSPIRAIDFAMQMKERGVRDIVLTDISRVGMMSGPNHILAQETADLTGLNVIYSGGIASLNDIEHLSRGNVQGGIICTALYNKTIHFTSAVNLFEKEKL